MFQEKFLYKYLLIQQLLPLLEMYKGVWKIKDNICREENSQISKIPYFMGLNPPRLTMTFEALKIG